MFYCSYYLCFKCKDPYFGGMKACNPEEEQKDFKPEELVCAKCSNVGMNAGVGRCGTHGTDFIDFKCKFCCSVALWFCWGTTHFCDPCHRNAGSAKPKPCKG